ncbi:MAG TPA: NUDIX hydrolase [Candidatus Saccharimonadales bacterium]|nr:NUDIX hydrolase [Candidatus Saccharimonadales bacterium]
MKDLNPWKTISSKTVYENPWMRVREDAVIRPDGTDGIYGVMESKDSVVIVTLNKDNEVYLIRSFNYPVSTWSWGLPGGGGDDEHPEVASKRELAEETGITASTWTFLGRTRVSSGLMTEKMAVYLAEDLSFGDRLEADDKDLISEGKFVSFEDIDQMIRQGEIDDAQTVTGLYLVLRLLDKR